MTLRCVWPRPEFPELSGLSREQLEDLLEDDDRLEELVETLPQLKPLLDDLQNTMDRVEKLAGKYCLLGHASICSRFAGLILNCNPLAKCLRSLRHCCAH